MNTGPAGFDKSGKVLYVQDSRGRNTGGLFAIDLESGEKTLVAEDPKADVGELLVHPTEMTIQAVGFTYSRREWTVLDESIQADLDTLATVEDGELIVTSRTLDDQLWTCAFVLDDGPLKFYLYDRQAQQCKFLFSSRDDLDQYQLAKMHAPVIPSRDGLELVSYLTLPVSSDRDHDGRPNQPLPLVLDVHGGPWARDGWGYNASHQWLANRGYAVLSVNYRGSTGFGKEFTNAANGEWAGKMHDDLIDAVEWAVREGIADRDKVAIMGGSYGGYATLVGLTFTPEVFACGVDIVGPSSLVTLMENVPEYWMPFMPVMKIRVGEIETAAGREALLERSPLTRVDQITKPLLIGQGANDPRVTQLEADQIVAAMKSKNIPVTYVLYPDEGHGFSGEPNRMSFNAVTEAFLAKYLGGRAEPIGDDFQESSLHVPAGADALPGLVEALPKERQQMPATESE
jgi:dipeptidyl aminopeptidase/acylaminoacyl peptidase